VIIGGTDWGEWGDYDICDPGTFAVTGQARPEVSNAYQACVANFFSAFVALYYNSAFKGLLEVKHSKMPEKEKGDETGLNQVGFRCDSGKQLKATEGAWGITDVEGRCPANTAPKQTGVPYQHNFRIIGASMRIKAANDDDNEAANDIKFKCSDGTILHPSSNQPTRSGEWSDFSTCEYGFVIGLKTQVQAPVTGDNTALNKVALQCGRW
jgi:hypothetical protein